MNRRPTPDALALWLPLAAASIYLLFAAVHLQDIVSALYRHPDAASAPVLTELLDGAPSDRKAFLGNYAWYESLWALQATDGFPNQRAVWQAIPFVTYAFTVLLVAGGAAALYGRRIGALAVVVLVSLGEPAREIFLTPNFHGPTYAHAALVGAAVVLLARRETPWPRWALALIAVVLGVLTAPGIASDNLSLAVITGPLAATAVVLWFKTGRWEVPACLLGTCAIALLLGDQLHQAMVDDGIEPQQFELAFLEHRELFDRTEGAIEAFASLVGGDIFSRKVGDLSTLVRFGMLVLAAAGVVALVRVLRSHLRTPKVVEPATVAPGLDAARLAWVTFWVVGASASVIGFVLGNTLGDFTGARYLGAVWLGVAGLLGVLAGGATWRRLAVGAAVGLFALGGAYTMAREGDNDLDGFVTTAEVNQLAAFAKAQGVDSGLAPYLASHNVTWATRNGLRLLPISECRRQFIYCPAPVHQVTTTYRPDPGTKRSIVVIDARQPDVPEPDPAWGRPVANAQFGQLRAYIYPYDVRRRISILVS